MSEADVTTLRRVTEHFNATGDFGPPEAFDPTLTFTTRGDVGSPQTFHGPDGIRDALADFGEAWERIQAELLEVFEGEEVLVAVIRFEVHSRAGVDLELEEGWAYWFRDGRIVRIEQHGDREKALQSAGLAGPGN